MTKNSSAPTRKKKTDQIRQNVQTVPPPRKIKAMPKKLEHPDGQLWVRWVCQCCKKTGLMTLPSKGQGSGVFPFEVALGIHRTISKSCNVKDVTMRGGGDGVLEVVLERRKLAKNLAANA